jgi:predicted lipoprotein
MRICALILAGLFGLPAHAEVADVVNDVIVPGYSAFADATAALSSQAQKDCTPETLRPAWNAAFDAWLQVAHFRLGPVEEDGRGLSIAFWPDPKGLGAKAQIGLLEAGGDSLTDPAKFAETSVAARGLFGLERLMYPATPEFKGDAACALIRATTGDLAATAAKVLAEWTETYAETVLTAGEPGNQVFLTQNEARTALLTVLIAGLEFDADQRIGRPLGEFDKPRPERAEARASGRSQRNLVLSLAALDDLRAALVPESPLTAAAFARARTKAEALDDPVFAGVADPQGWLKLEIVQQSVHAVRDAAMTEMVPALGVGLGFNAADGD